MSSRALMFGCAVLLCCVHLLLSGCQSGGADGKTRGTRPAEVPSVTLRQASLVRFRGANSREPARPGDTDCNSPAHWDGDTLYVFNSAGHPWRSSGPNVLRLNESYVRTEYDNTTNGGRWIES